MISARNCAALLFCPARYFRSMKQQTAVGASLCVSQTVPAFTEARIDRFYVEEWEGIHSPRNQALLKMLPDFSLFFSSGLTKQAQGSRISLRSQGDPSLISSRAEEQGCRGCQGKKLPGDGRMGTLAHGSHLRKAFDAVRSLLQGPVISTVDISF